MSLKNSSRYLTVLFGMMAITGLVLTYTPFMTDLAGGFYYDVYAGEGSYAELAPRIRDNQLFVYGISGALMSAWSFALAVIAAIPLAKGERWAFYLIALSVTVWYIGDSFISIATGFWLHAVFNTIFLILIEIGLWGSYRAIQSYLPANNPALARS